MKNKAYVFYENQEENWKRYPSFISRELDGDKFFVYSVKGRKKNSNISKQTFIKSLQFSGSNTCLFKEFQEYEELIVILMSFRAIDLLFFTSINKYLPTKVIKGISIQHGYYSDKLERESIFNFVFRTQLRIRTYLQAFLMTKVVPKSIRLTILKEVFEVYYSQKLLFRESRTLSKYLILPQNILIFSSDWEEYFNSNFYGSNHPNFIKILPRDFELLKSAIHKPSSVVIISQSLVEDGRYSKKDFREELNSILSCIPRDKTVYIKRHPRNTKDLFENLQRDVHITNEFIVGDYIISGYSSLMQPYFEIGSNVFRWNFKNHHNPKIFDRLSTQQGREAQLINFFNLTVKKINLQPFHRLKVDKSYAEIISKI